MPKIEVFELERLDENHSFAQQQLEAGLQWLQSRGSEIQRFKIPADGPASVENPTVRTAIELQGQDALPILLVNGIIITVGGYPSRTELLTSAGFRAAEDPGFLREALALAAGMSAALAGNNLVQFRLNYERARSLGLPVDDLRDLIESAKAAAGEAIRDETLTKVEQFLAFGPAGKLKAPRCSCSGNS